MGSVGARRERTDGHASRKPVSWRTRPAAPGDGNAPRGGRIGESVIGGAPAEVAADDRAPTWWPRTAGWHEMACRFCTKSPPPLPPVRGISNDRARATEEACSLIPLDVGSDRIISESWRRPSSTARPAMGRRSLLGERRDGGGSSRARRRRNARRAGDVSEHRGGIRC
jgi:hypothetical protein